MRPGPSLCLALAACTASVDVSTLPPLLSSTVSGTSDRDGLFEVEVEADADTTTFLLTGRSDAQVGVERLITPSGEVVLDVYDWLDSDDSLTDAVFPEYTDVVFNWPVRAQDGALTPGTWTVVLAAADTDWDYLPGAAIDATVLRKQADDLSAGVVQVTLAYAGDLEDDAALGTAVDQAVAHWRRIWEAQGIQLAITSRGSDLPPVVAAPEADERVATLSAEGEDTDVLVILADRVANDPGTYGIAGGIPGTPLATARSATVVSWLEHAGRDGAIDADEARLMGETMAHEVGHYLGLFHPVEDGYDAWDALDDTARCRSEVACEEALQTNVMFPYAVCGGGGCVAQTELSGDQSAVLQRYTATR